MDFNAEFADTPLIAAALNNSNPAFHLEAATGGARRFSAKARNVGKRYRKQLKQADKDFHVKKKRAHVDTGRAIGMAFRVNLNRHGKGPSK